MNFETWWKTEGSVMFKRDCSAKIIALGMKVLNDPIVSEKMKALVRIEIKNQKKLMEVFGME